MKWSVPVRAGIVQPLTEPGNVESNLDTALELMEDCSDSTDPDLIILPEAFTTGFPFEKLDDLANESQDALDQIRRASRSGGYHSFFTMIIKDGEGKLRNRLYHIDDNGELRSTYDKTQLFSRTGEEKYITPGNEMKIFNIEKLRIGPLICYELRYPELSRSLTVSGVHILIYPSLWPDFRIFQWETLLMARAIENQLFVIGTNSVGTHSGVKMGGGSRIISPFGNILTDCARDPGWKTATLDPEELWSLRKKIPVLEDRKEPIQL